MNRLAFQTYGTKKLSLFQSVWDTTKNSVVSTTELANTAATTPLPLGWTGTNLLTGGYTHTAGNTAVLLVNNLTPTAGQSYQIVCTLSAGSVGSVIINFGGVSSASLTATTTTILTPINAAIKLSITPSNDFVGTVSLSVKTSSSALNQIQLPITLASGKSVWIDWGDGQYSTANSTNIIANRIHTYTTPGEYPVKVFGDDFSFGFAGGINDRLKIKSISSWGKLKIGGASFYGCSNLTMSGITDILDLTGVTSLDSTFYDCREVTTIGRINEWNTSSIIDGGSLFRGCYKFNSDISNWNVSNFTNMFAMLYDARAFNQPIGNWERSTPGNVSTMSKVVSIRSMFSDAYAFNQNIGAWNVSNVLDMGYTFRRTYAFNQNLSNWNVTKVAIFENMFDSATAFNNGSAATVANQLPWTINTSLTASVIMGSMFVGATAFNSNLGTGTTPWNVSKVTTFGNMFNGATAFNNGSDTAPINNWDINTGSNVSMSGMFNNADAFNRAISGWDMTKVTNTSSMFANTNVFNQSLSNWERVGSTMGNVTDMSSMFFGTYAFNQNIGNWNVNKVTNFQSMFQASAFNNNGSPDINNWIINTTSGANVRMNNMFVTTGFNQPLDNWNTSEVTNMSLMFGQSPFNNGFSSGFAGTLAWNTGKVTRMDGMFGTNSRFNCNIGSWNVSNCINFSTMFQEASNFNNGGSDTINTWAINTMSNVTMSNMFNNADAFNRTISGWDMTKVTNTSSMFANTNVFNQSLLNWERPGSTMGNVTDMSSMFASASAFNQNIGVWNVSNVTTFVSMFNGATAFNNNGSSDINNWAINTVSNVTMGNMFVNASNFNMPISNWNMTKVNNTAGMFNGTTLFNQPLANWERAGSTTGNITTMQSMFQGAYAFNQNIGNWNVNKVTIFQQMFQGIGFNNGGSSDINGWNINTNASVNMQSMFNSSGAFNQPLNSWNTSEVTNMNSMFSNAPAFNQNIGSWNVSNVTNFASFMSLKTPATFSTTNLDAIYNGWSSRAVKPNISIAFGTAKYTAAGTPGKNILIGSPNNWTITDGGI
jgi:surface protein